MLVERSFPVDRLDDVQVELRRGDVRVFSSSDPAAPTSSVQVVATLGPNVLETDLEIWLEGGQLRVLHRPRGRLQNLDLLGGLEDIFSEGFGSLFGEFGRIDVSLVLPARVAQCRIATGLGSLDVAGYQGALLGRTGKGDVAITDGQGNLQIQAGLGAIRLARFTGHVDAAAGKGDLDLENVSGDAAVKTGLGTIRVRDCDVRLTADAGKGDLFAERVSGAIKLTTGLGTLEAVDTRGADVEATTGKGDVTLSGAFGAINVHTGLGSVLCRATTLADSSEFNVGHGGVSIGLSGALPVRLDASTSRGAIDSEFPLVQVGRPGPESAFGRRLVGTIGEGEPRATLRLRLVNGNVRVFRIPLPTAIGAAPAGSTGSAADQPTGAGESGPAATPAQPVTPATTTATAEPATPSPGPERHRLDVLERLSRGEISVEQADALLREGS